MHDDEIEDSDQEKAANMTVLILVTILLVAEPTRVGMRLIQHGLIMRFAAGVHAIGPWLTHLPGRCHRRMDP